MKRNIVIVFVLISCMSCNTTPLLPKDYVDWIENVDNGLRVHKTISDFEFTLQYQPIDYIVAMQEKTNKLMKEFVEKEKAERKDMQYFVLRVGSADQQGPMLKTALNNQTEYYERINYFSSAMQSDLQLIDGQDTMPCKLFHFERTYELAPYNSMVLGFELSEYEKSMIGKNKEVEHRDKTVVFEDNILNTGTVRLTISGVDIDNIPSLRTF